MSFSYDGIKFKYNPSRRGFFLHWIVKGGEIILSVLFIVSLAGPIVFPHGANAVAGVPALLSYQGRLTDTNGNPYTGTYCIRFSIYDTQGGGTKLWPAGTPTATSTIVSNGVFNAPVGEMDSLTSYDFSANNTEYLNIDVYNVAGSSCTGGSWESLTPRQQLSANAYARVAGDVYGTALRTSSVRVQVGLGTGQATPIWTRFDNQNTGVTIGAACPSGSVMGDMWFNSSGTRALMCGTGTTIVGLDNASEIAGIKEQSAGSAITGGTVNFSGSNNITISQTGSTLQFSVPSPAVNVFGMSNLGNTSGTTGVVSSSGARMLLVGGNNVTLSQSINGSAVTITISAGAGGGGGIAIGAGTQTATSGTIVFQNGNNVTFGLNGQTLTASAPAGGGGGGVTISHWPPFAMAMVSSSNYTGATAAGTNITASFHVAPLQLPAALSFSRINMIGGFSTIAGTGSQSIAHMLGIYTLNGGTALSLSTSFMFRDEISQNSVTAQSHRFYWGTNSTSNSSSSGGNISASYTGLRVLPMFVSAGGAALSAGQYYIAYAQTNRSSSAAVMPAASIMYMSAASSTQGGQLGSASTLTPFPLLGYFSSTTAVGNYTTPFMPSSINTDNMTLSSSAQWKWPYVQFLGK